MTTASGVCLLGFCAPPLCHFLEAARAARSWERPRRQMLEAQGAITARPTVNVSHAPSPPCRPARLLTPHAARRFDSTISVDGGRDKLWPATMENGVPYDCDAGGNDCSSSESYPGMW